MRTEKNNLTKLKRRIAFQARSMCLKSHGKKNMSRWATPRKTEWLEQRRWGRLCSHGVILFCPPSVLSAPLLPDSPMRLLFLKDRYQIYCWCKVCTDYLAVGPMVQIQTWTLLFIHAGSLSPSRLTVPVSAGTLIHPE